MKALDYKIARGEYLDVFDQKRVLFGDFAEEYLDFSKATKSAPTHRRDVTSLKPNLIPFFGSYLLTEITPQMIEKYRIERIATVEPATVNREVGCLMHLYKKAIEWGQVSVNPTTSVKKLKEPPGRTRYLTVEEIHRLLDQCSDGIRPIIITALNTGLRKSELLGLRWSDVDFFHHSLTVTKTKNNEPKTVPLNGLLLGELRKLSKNRTGEFVFVKKDGQPFGDLKVGFAGACQRAGINNFRFHDLRHTFASHLVMSGVNIRTVQQLLGHKDIRQTQRYSHLSTECLEEAVQILGTNMAQAIIDNRGDARKLLKNIAAPVAQ